MNLQRSTFRVDSLTHISYSKLTKFFSHPQIAICLDAIAKVKREAKELTEALINNEDFCIYMSSRAWTTLAMNDIYKAQCDYIEKIDSICQALNYNIEGYEVHYLND